jgi:hypothetical protein
MHLLMVLLEQTDQEGIVVSREVEEVYEDRLAQKVVIANQLGHVIGTISSLVM